MDRNILDAVMRRLGKSQWADEMAEELLKSGKSVAKVYQDENGNVVTRIIKPDEYVLHVKESEN